MAKDSRAKVGFYWHSIDSIDFTDLFDVIDPIDVIDSVISIDSVDATMYWNWEFIFINIIIIIAYF